jgi:hypothetical protein
VVQVETGIRLDVDRPQGRRLVIGPEPLVRIGVSDRWELRLSDEGFLSPVQGAAARGWSSGWGDLSVGAKIRLREAGQRGPRLSLIARLSLPVGTAPHTSGGYDPGLSLIWKENLTENLGVGGTLNVASESGDAGRHWRRSASVSFTRSLPWQLQGYFETYIIQPRSDGGNEWASDAGLARKLTPNTQVDVAVGRALRPAPQTWFVTVGFSFRVGRSLVLLRQPRPPCLNFAPCGVPR